MLFRSAAIAYAAVTPTVQPGTGAGLEMDAIGGVFVGGVAATGGYGSVIGTFVGIFVIMLLNTGLPYVGLQANWQQIITGLVLIVAVLIDIIKEKKKAAIDRGILYTSGMIAGEGLVGILLAVFAVVELDLTKLLGGFSLGQIGAILIFLVVVIGSLFKVTLFSKENKN